MIKHQIFVSKYLLAQTPRNKHQQRIFDLLKLINKDTTVIINILFQCCCHHFSAQYYVASGHFYCLLHIINGKRTQMPSTALHFFELLSRQFLGNFPKTTNQLFFKTSLDAYFKLTSDISPKSARFKNQQPKS